MRWQQLKRQLLRDLKRSPKKAAALGLLAVVGLYFWAPLVTGWMKPETGRSSRRKAKPASAATAMMAAAMPQPATAPTETLPELDWESVDRLLREDVHAMTAEHLTSWKDPFVREEEIAEDKIAEAEPPKPVATPESEGLSVSMTLVGARRRSAVIGGKTYHEGDLIETKSGARFRLAQVKAHQIILESDGNNYQLAVRALPTSDRIQVHVNNP